MRIVSLNLRYAHSADMNNQGVREPRIVDFVREYAPHSMGVQECEKFWRDRLSEKLSELGYVPAQDEAIYNEKSYAFKNFIWYAPEKAELLESGRLWLSSTPINPSKGFGSRFFISAGYAILKIKETGECYTHVNTHLDVSSEEIRLEEIKILKEKISELEERGYPIFLTGDFNSEEDSAVYEFVSEYMCDARKTAAETTELNTFNAYSVEGVIIPSEKFKRIDFCFYRDAGKRITVDKFDVVDRWRDGYMSDHNALVIDGRIG